MDYVTTDDDPPNFQAILVRDGTEDRLLAFQDITRREILAKEGRLRFWSNDEYYVEVDQTILEVPDRIDALYYDGNLLISDQRKFERIFDYMAEFYSVVETAVERIAESNVPVHSTDMFFDAATSYPNAARLMYAVNERALWEHENIDMNAFEHIIEDFELSVESEERDGRRGITMSSKTQIWELIHLYNDDYLDSPITEERYQARGKDAAGEPEEEDSS